MKTKLIIVLILFSKNLLIAQNFSYQQTHKEIEYDYGIIDSAGLQKISEIEKIKYELKYTEKTVNRKIDQTGQTTLEVTIDSNGYQKDWMNLAKKFRYDENGMQILNQNSTVKTIPYSPEQIAERANQKDQIQSNGFHPGIIGFPEFTSQQITQLATQNIVVQNVSSGVVKVSFQNQTTTYNKPNLTITREWVDKNGFKNKETAGYESLLNNKGYLLKIRKFEKYINSVNGPCITEVKLTLYLGYTIQDEGHLIDKALNQNESIHIYPNPNDGVFTVNVQLLENSNIVSAKIINILTGHTTILDNATQNTFLVNLPSLETGNYVLQVITNNTTINTHFFKF